METLPLWGNVIDHGRKEARQYGRKIGTKRNDGIVFDPGNPDFCTEPRFVAVNACRGTYSFANEVFGDVIAEAPPGHDKSFVVAESDDLFTVSKNLESEGLVANAYSFYIRLKLSMGKKSIVQAKTYTLNTSMTYDEILDEIVKEVK